MIGGRISALAAAKRSGFINEEEFIELEAEQVLSLDKLRKGMFCHENKGRKDIFRNDEGYNLSISLLEKGFIAEDEILNFPEARSNKKGPHPEIECTQNIP